MRLTSLLLLLPFVSLFVASIADAAPIEKCTGNFEEAQLKEKRGKLVEAEQLYAACADSQCPSMIRSDCSLKRDEIIRRIPTITIVIRDASGNDVTGYVEVDGKPVQDRTRAQPIDPGEHTVGYRAEGQKPATQKITVVEGEKARVITITAQAGKDVPQSAGTPGSTAPTTTEGPSIVGPVILGSVGLLALFTGIGLQVYANSEDDKAKEFQAKGEDPANINNRQEFLTAADSRKDSAQNNQRLAIVAGVTGFVFIAGGVTWFLLSRASSKKSASSFTPVVAPGFAGASYGLRF
jgi:hypothetical protein